MAKRRNPKKEKALRNQEYARRFRKRSNSGRFFRRRTNQGPSRDSEEQTNNQNGASSEGAMD
ncbi:MAG: hypothetical protein MJA27_08120 [Pseudanabaenales cyanobacterium]|nr:hypothetical protein [Pseudanabaenales cyanobacterium]